MSKKNKIKELALQFAVRIVRLFNYLKTNKGEFILCKQILRSGTSIGANISEADFAETKKDFIHKMAIAQKETSETIYWLELLKRTEYITNEEYQSLEKDLIPIAKILATIILNAKQQINRTQHSSPNTQH